MTEAAVGELVALASAGQRRAVGRLLSIVEAGDAEAEKIAELVLRHPRQAHVVGITGAPGTGKSTLTGQVVARFSAAGRRPAVLAVDPSSPLTGGAILGDRIRMDDVTDEAVFIRSMATRGHAGGLALAVPGALEVLVLAGYDPVIVETVGVGQVEVDVAGAADTTVVVVNPGWGDAVQANKAGLLELADLFVVNKADRPGASDTRRDLELMLDLSHVTGQQGADGRRPPIVMAASLDGTGADEVADAIDEHLGWLTAHDLLDLGRAERLGHEVGVRLLQDLEGDVMAALEGAEGQALLELVTNGEITPAAAARTMRDQLGVSRRT